MRILHAAALLRPSSGIINQMRWEQAAANEIGLDWAAKMFCPKGWLAPDDVIQNSECVQFIKNSSSAYRRALNWIMLRHDYHRWLKSFEELVDVYVLRHYVHDPFQAAFISSVSKPVYLMHHTLEVPELYGAGNMLGRLRAALETTVGNYSIRRSDLTIGVTKEIIDYECARVKEIDRPSILYPNGVHYDEGGMSDRRSDVPTFLFTASFFSDWHGLDILLQQVVSSEESFRLHIVGEVSNADREIAESDPRVVLHGKLDASHIRELSEECWIGLSSFALWRKGMTEACPLKVREYLSSGLPVYAGHHDVFPREFPFFQTGTCEITRLLEFSLKVRSTSFAEVANISRPYIDKKILLSGLVDSIARAVGS